MVFTEADVRLMQGVRLIWVMLNTGFTVFISTPELCDQMEKFGDLK